MKYSKVVESIRSVCAAMDNGIYSLISGAFQVFFNVANANILSSTLITDLFSRIQLIFGVIILFRLAISLISGIVNPDAFSNEKTGFGKVITRVVISLVLVVTIIPLNLSGDFEQNSLQDRINKNGIMFGLMYDIQDRVFSNNTLGKIIIGPSVPSSQTSSEANNEYVEDGNNLAKGLLKSFYNVNVTDAAEKKIRDDPRVATPEFYADETNRLDGDSGNNTTVQNIEADTCGDIEGDPGCSLRYTLEQVSSLSDGGIKKYFVWDYRIFLSSLCGIFVLIMLLGFVIDIAIRSFKLIILRIIAIVPIIAYIDPKSDKMLQTWGETTLKTYIDIFLRVGVMYFVMLIAAELPKSFTKGNLFVVNSGAVGAFSYLFILLGLFFFARQAPEFILGSIGMKTGDFFKNVGRMFTGVGMLGSGLAGGITGGIAGYRASMDATELKNPRGNKGLRRARAGLEGGYRGMRGLLGNMYAYGHAKNRRWGTAWNGMTARNTELMDDGSKGVSELDRLKGNAGSAIGNTPYNFSKRREAQLQRDQEAAKQALQEFQRTTLNPHKQALEEYKQQHFTPANEVKSKLNAAKKEASNFANKYGVEGMLKNIQQYKKVTRTVDDYDENGLRLGSHEETVMENAGVGDLSISERDARSKIENRTDDELVDINGTMYKVGDIRTNLGLIQKTATDNAFDHMNDSFNGKRLAEDAEFMNPFSNAKMLIDEGATQEAGVTSIATNSSTLSSDIDKITNFFTSTTDPEIHRREAEIEKDNVQLQTYQDAIDSITPQIQAVQKKIQEQEAATSHNRGGGPGGH